MDAHAKPGFVPLHVKSHHSIGLGTASIPALVQHAGRLGFGALALTDVENLYGQVQFHAACRALGLQAMTGVELRSDFQQGRSLGGQRGRVVLLASDAVGYVSVCQIVTRRRTGPARTGPPFESLAGLGSGVFVLTDDAELLRALVQALGREPVRALLVRPLASGKNPEQRLIAAARELDVELVADIDAELLEDRDQPLQELVRAVHQNRRAPTPLPSPNHRSARALLPPEAIEQLFADLPDALAATQRIARACSFDLLRWSRDTHGARVADAERQLQLEQRCMARLASAGSTPRAESVERLATELHVIETLGLTDLFCSVAALVDRAHERGIPIAARGSAVSSLTLHLLGASPIDPLRHGLYFERFVHAARSSPPDIDLDVASERRTELSDWFMGFRGPLRAARPCALTTFQPRSAHREGLKAIGAPAQVIETFLRGFPPDELAGDERWPISEARLPSPWCQQLVTIRALIGMPRHISAHPGGIVLAEPALGAGLPIERGRSGVDVCQYDAESLTRLGVPKIDLLGSHCLDEQDATLSSLSARGALEDTPLRLPPDGEFPLQDAATLELIDRGQTLGCFQIESPALRAVLVGLPIRGLEDVTHALAIVRPGPASGHAKQLFLERARGEASEPELPAPLRQRLGATHGVLLYEEDISFTLVALTGISLPEAEALRVKLAEREDSDWVDRTRSRFLGAAEARGFTAEEAGAVWSMIARFARYSFNKAHAVSQALLAYQSAYLKCHAPIEFGCALLNHHGGLYPRRVIASELTRRGLALLAPSLLHSRLECSIEDRRIRIGLASIKGLRAASRRRLLASRDRARSALSPEAWLASAGLQPRELRALIWCGAGDDLFGLGASDYPWVHEALLEQLEGARREPLPAVIASARARRPVDPPELVTRYQSLSRIQNELRYLELHISDHPLRVLRAEADHQGCITTEHLRAHVGKKIRFAGLVAAARSIPVAAHGVGQFLTFEDEHGLVEARLSPLAYERLHARVTTPGPFLVDARVDERHGAVSLAIDDLVPFHERAGSWPTR